MNRYRLFSILLLLTNSLTAGADILSDKEIMSQRSLGNPDSKITIYNYFSIDSKYSRDFYLREFPKLKKNYIYTGKIHYIMTDVNGSGDAHLANLLARCASPKDEYFTLFDVYFKKWDYWEKKLAEYKSSILKGDTKGCWSSGNCFTLQDDEMKRLAHETTSMSRHDVSQCIDNQSVISNLKRRRPKIQGTPYFAIEINGKRVAEHLGYIPYRALSQFIDTQL